MANVPEHMTAEDTIQRGRQAKRLLEDPILEEAFGRAEDAFIQMWANSKPKDVNLREQAYANIQALAEVQRMLRTLVSSGDVRLAELKRRGVVDRETRL